MADGVFIVADLFGADADRIAALQRELDPKFAAVFRPHVTLAGSSGVGPLPPDIPLAIELRSKALRDAYPDPGERARVTATATRAWLHHALRTPGGETL